MFACQKSALCISQNIMASAELIHGQEIFTANRKTITHEIIVVNELSLDVSLDDLNISYIASRVESNAE